MPMATGTTTGTGTSAGPVHAERRPAPGAGRSRGTRRAPYPTDAVADDRSWIIAASRSNAFSRVSSEGPKEKRT